MSSDSEGSTRLRIFTRHCQYLGHFLSAEFRFTSAPVQIAKQRFKGFYQVMCSSASFWWIPT